METQSLQKEEEIDVETNEVLQNFRKSVERFILTPIIDNLEKALIDSRPPWSLAIDSAVWERRYSINFANEYETLIDLLFRQIEIIRNMEYSGGELVDYCRRNASRDLASLKFKKQDLTDLSKGRLGSIGVYSAGQND